MLTANEIAEREHDGGYGKPPLGEAKRLRDELAERDDEIVRLKASKDFYRRLARGQFSGENTL